MKKKNKRNVRNAILIFLIILLSIIVAVFIGLIVQDKKKGNADSEEIAQESEYVDIDQVEAPYEHWLIAAVVTSISMDYPDFELQKTYISGETSVEQHLESEGVYVSFISSGEEKCIYSKPIDKLRSEEGTFDIFAEYIGYATYDEVEKVDLEKYKETNVDNMGVLIEQLVRVTKYMN